MAFLGTTYVLIKAKKEEKRAKIENTMGEVYMNLGLYEIAEKLLMDSLEIRKKISSSSMKEIAESMENLGRVYFFESKYKEAENLFKKL